MTEITKENYHAVLAAKHKRLVTALEVSEALLEGYIVVLKHLTDNKEKWEDNYDWDFNLLHDLVGRMTDRVRDNYIEIGDWNWKVQGFNVITIPNQVN